jgi:hypothetical protein
MLPEPVARFLRQTKSHPDAPGQACLDLNPDIRVRQRTVLNQRLEWPEPALQPRPLPQAASYTDIFCSKIDAVKENVKAGHFND